MGALVTLGRNVSQQSAIETSAPRKLSDVVLDTRIRKATHSSTLLRNALLRDALLRDALLRDACCAVILADREGRDLPEQKERTQHTFHSIRL